MKNKKISFKDIKGMLSRDEMKQIKGGSGAPCSSSAVCGSSMVCCKPPFADNGICLEKSSCLSNGGTPL